MGRNFFSDRNWAKGSIKAVIISRTCSKQKIVVGITKRGIGRVYEALRYTLGVYLSLHNTVAVALAGPTTYIGTKY